MDLDCGIGERRQTFEMRCYRRLLNISYKDNIADEEVRRKVQAAIGDYDDLLTLVKKRKLRWFKVFWLSKDNPKGHSERKRKKRQTEEEVERQYQIVDTNRLFQLS